MNLCKISYQYSENSKRITLTVYKSGKTVAKIVTDKKTNVTTTEVFKEGGIRPIDTFVFDRI